MCIRDSIKGSNVVIYKGGTTEKMLQCNGDGETSLWHDGVKRVATTSSGCTVTGEVTATSFSGSGANLTNLPASGLGYVSMLKHF